MADVQTVADWTTQVAQWMEQGGLIVAELRGMVGECDKTQRELAALQQRYAVLEQECATLRRAVDQLTDQIQRARHEHAETAEWFSTVMLEAAARLKGTRFLTAGVEDVPPPLPDNLPVA